MHTLHRPTGRRYRRMLVTLLAVALALLGGTSAHAVQVGACGWSEQAFLTAPTCTRTGVIDAQKISGGRLLEPSDLLKNLEVYERYGFTEEWIKSAPRITLTVTSGMTWSGCWYPPGAGDDGLCQPSDGEQVVPAVMSDLFPVGMTFTAIGTPEKWIALMCGNFSPMPGTRADIAKTGFTVQAPRSIEADTDVPVTVRAVLTNRGPAPSTTVTDSVTVLDSSPDCTVTPRTQSRQVTINQGSPSTQDFQFVVHCTEPSDHWVTFGDQLVGQPGVYDPVLTDNTATATWSFEVYDHSDLALSSPSLSCTGSTTVGTTFTCGGSVVVTNRGPYGPTTSATTLGLELPKDCRITSSNGGAFATELPVNQPTTVSGTWTLECSNRSYHPITLASATKVTHQHVTDLNPANNAARASATVQVFEPVDLEVVVTQLTCSERETNGTSSRCTAVVTATNNGPATNVVTETDVVFTVADGCTAAPSSTSVARTLSAGSSQTFQVTTTITCPTAARHSVEVSATLHNAPTDPHAVDRNTDVLTWVPLDIKPQSLPSSINVKKRGVIPFAILGTADFDPTTDLDQSSIHFGVNGTEQILRCQTGGEDTNGDGWVDLVCFTTVSLSGVTCDTREMQVWARRLDGTRVTSQDAVKVVGC